ncbi:MAG: Pup--protein ligase [Propionibacteriaceae bacterium]
MRIYGLETEFGLLATASGSRMMSPEDAARVLFRPIVEKYSANNIFLENGSRLYLDVGSHPEYATAECSDIPMLLAHDRAGEERMLELAQQADKQLENTGRAGKICLFKNNTDSYGNSYGCHENYLVSRIDDFSSFTEALIPFLVTRQLLCGAGKLLQSQGQTEFLVSQRADHMAEEVASTTTQSRPMINTRDEPHADPRRFRRMHVIVGDSNLAEVSTLLKVGTTELVLRLLEQKGPQILADAVLADPISAIKAVARDHYGRAAIELADGIQVTALDIQERYLDLCSELTDLDDVLLEVLHRWEQVLTCLRQRHLEPLATQVEWVAKFLWLQRYAEKHQLSLSDRRLAHLDLAWHQITDGGVCRLLERSGAIERLTDVSEVKTAMLAPPDNTRAALRGKFLAAARQARRDVEVDWVQLHVKDIRDGTVRLTDPFAASDQRVEDLLARLDKQSSNTTVFDSYLPL